MERCAAAKRALSYCGDTTSSFPGSYRKDTCPECHVSHISRLMIRVIMVWYGGLCTNLLGIALVLRKCSGKSQLGDRIVKAVRPVITSNRVPYIQMRSVESHRMWGREKEGMDKTEDQLGVSFLLIPQWQNV